MIRYSFDAEVTFEGVTKKVTTVSISQTYSDIYPTLTAEIFDPEDNIEIDYYDTVSRLPEATVTINLYIQERLANSIAVKGVVIAISHAENTVERSSTLTIAPAIAITNMFIDSFDGIGTPNYLSSGRSLLNAIIGRYNFFVNSQGFSGIFLLSNAVVLSVKDFIPITAPRFVAMSHIDMMRQIAEARGLNIRVGFDNVVRVGSLAKPHSSNIRLSQDMVESAEITSDVLMQVFG